MDKPVIIPQSVLSTVEQIREARSQNMNVYVLKSRQSGRALIQQLLTTEDIPYEQINQPQTSGGNPDDYLLQ